MVIAEAFACGVPVITSRLGALREIVKEGCTGLHASTGNAADWAERLTWAWGEPDTLVEMGHEARHTWQACYTAERNASQLEEIYRDAIAQRGATRA